MVLGPAARAETVAVRVATGVADGSSPAQETAVNELARRGISADDPRLSRAARRLFPARVEALAPVERKRALTTMERGYQDWLAGRVEAAVTTLEAARRQADRNPSSLAGDAELRRALFRTLVVLVLAADRAGDGDRVTALVREVNTRFPDTALDRASFGPRAAELFERHAGDGDRGVALEVRAHPGEGIYVDERFIGRGRARIDVAAGSRRVLLVGAGGRRWQRTVKVRADTAVDVGTATPRWEPDLGGLVIVDPDGLDKPLAALAAAAGIQEIVALVHQPGGLLAIRVGAGGSRLASASLSRARLADSGEVRGLARAVVGNGGADDGGPSRVVPYALMGVGAAALATGVVLLALDGRETCSDQTGTCPEVYEFTAAGWISAGLGVAAIAGGASLRWWPRDEDRSVVAAPASGGGSLVVSGRF